MGFWVGANVPVKVIIHKSFIHVNQSCNGCCETHWQCLKLVTSEILSPFMLWHFPALANNAWNMKLSFPISHDSQSGMLKHLKF